MTKNNLIKKTLSTILAIILIVMTFPVTALADDNYNSVINNAGQLAQQQLINRISQFDVSFDLSKSYEPNNVPTDFMNSIFANDNKISYKAGDYLFFTYNQIDYKCEITDNNNFYNYKFTVYATYYDDLQQENYIDTKTDEIIRNMNLNGLSDYDKASKINDWIYDNLSYDYNVIGYLPFTAYNALTTGKVVCQGYSTLTYLLSCKAGLDVHIIRSVAHSWLAVKINNKFYYWDPTYTKSAGNKYKYFLVCAKHSSGEVVDNSFNNVDFFNKYTISDSCYNNCNLTVIDKDDKGVTSTQVNTNTSTNVKTENNSKTSAKNNNTKIQNLKAKKSKNQINVSWKKNKNITGYQVQYSTSKKFKKKNTKTITIKKNKSSASFKKQKGKTYYIRVRAYKSSCKEHKKYAWSKVIKVKK